MGSAQTGGMKIKTGRPRGFDRDAMLTRVAVLFDRHGYEGLSVVDLATELDLSHPSLYAAFGPKSVLFRKALDAYAARWTRDARKALADPDLVRALRAFLDAQVEAFCDNRAGCMLSAALQTSASDHRIEARHAAGLRAAMVRTVRERLEQAVIDGDLNRSSDPALLASFLCGLVHGLSTLARDGASRDLAAGFVETGLAGVLTARAAGQTSSTAPEPSPCLPASGRTDPASEKSPSRTTDDASLADRLADLVSQVPGATERELTDLLYGNAAGPGRLTFWCHLLLNRGVIERSGAGGKQDPYRYRLAGAA